MIIYPSENSNIISELGMMVGIFICINRFLKRSTSLKAATKKNHGVKHILSRQGWKGDNHYNCASMIFLNVFCTPLFVQDNINNIN